MEQAYNHFNSGKYKEAYKYQYNIMKFTSCKQSQHRFILTQSRYLLIPVQPLCTNFGQLSQEVDWMAQ